MSDTHGIFWHETAPHEPTPPLRGELDVDVAIVGGGFSGLWTAYELTRLEPGLSIAILDAHVVGHGASGRNGGFAMTLLDRSLYHLVENVGPTAARAAHEAVAVSIEQMGEVCEREGIDCDFHRGGLLVVATNPSQEERLDRDLAAAEQIGLTDVVPLDATQTRALVDSPTYRRGYLESSCATIHPKKLARGLRNVLLERGVKLLEHTPALDHREDGTRVVITTPEGVVRCDHAVLTVNAWADDMPQLRRRVIPLYTYVVLTDPLSDAQLDRIGWAGRQGIEDKRNYVHYYRLTADNRILWGGRDGLVHAGVGIEPRHDRAPAVRDALHETFRATFPQLSDVGFSHHWGGPVAITMPFLPYVGQLRGGRIQYGMGYNGHGVAPSHTVACMLADRVLGRDRGLGDLPFVYDREPRFTRNKTVTWLACQAIRRSLLKQDHAMDRSERPAPSLDPWIVRTADRAGRRRGLRSPTNG